MRQFLAYGALALIGALAAAPALASPQCHGGASFERWLDTFSREAAAKGVPQAVISGALGNIRPDPDVIRKDRGQGTFAQSFLQFSDRMVAGYRLQQGAARLSKNRDLFSRIEQRYGVPGAVLTAFWGLETDFGANIGDMPTIRSLATLAYDCRRPAQFRDELLAALRIIQRGDLTAARMVGPWAGELGQVQFLPSVYLKHGVDFDGDGRRDLLRSAPDSLASAAAYAAALGWQRGQPWLEEVRVPPSMPWEQADIAIRHPRSYWARLGVTRAAGRALPADGTQTALLLPMGRFGPAFLAYPNFGIFTEWNQSLVYATTAAYYATRLAGAPAVRRGNVPVAALNTGQVRELQRLLAAQGYKVGEIDGKPGAQTRSAVKAAQLKHGMPADSYPTPELLQKLKSR